MPLSFSPFFPQSIINYGLANAACTSQQNVVVGGVIVNGQVRSYRYSVYIMAL